MQSPPCAKCRAAAKLKKTGGEASHNNWPMKKKNTTDPEHEFGVSLHDFFDDSKSHVGANLEEGMFLNTQNCCICAEGRALKNEPARVTQS